MDEKGINKQVEEIRNSIDNLKCPSGSYGGRMDGD